ncbi:MAG: hypothetical protein KGR22_11550 [Planctomycetes bacterium]|nr:hypothetical protein [Planctomycetota bacterium]
MAAPVLARLLDAQGIRVVACSSMSAVSKIDSPVASERSVASRLAQAERALQASSSWSPVTILRPTMIYGGATNRNVARIWSIGRQLGFVPCPSEPTGLRQPVHLEDVAEALVRCLGIGGARSRVIEMGGGERITLHGMIRRISDAAGVRCVLVPRWVVKSLASPLAARLLGAQVGALQRMHRDQIADNGEVERLLMIRPRAFAPESHR